MLLFKCFTYCISMGLVKIKCLCCQPGIKTWQICRYPKSKAEIPWILRFSGALRLYKQSWIALLLVWFSECSFWCCGVFPNISNLIHPSYFRQHHPKGKGEFHFFFFFLLLSYDVSDRRYTDLHFALWQMLAFIKVHSFRTLYRTMVILEGILHICSRLPHIFSIKTKYQYCVWWKVLQEYTLIIQYSTLYSFTRRYKHSLVSATGFWYDLLRFVSWA